MALQMSRLRFAKLIGTSTYTVYAWETGMWTPDSKNLLRLAEALGQTMDFFYE